MNLYKSFLSSVVLTLLSTVFLLVPSRTGIDEYLDPFLFYLKQENKITGADLKIADEQFKAIVSRVAQETKSKNISESRTLNTDKSRRELIETIAHQLREHNIIYSEESLLSHAFGKDYNNGNFYHLDCDLLTYLIASIAQRNGVELSIVYTPDHAYLFLPSVEKNNFGYYIESTEFREFVELKDSDGEVYGYDKSGKNLGADFWTTDITERARIFVSRRHPEHDFFFKPALISDVKNNIVSSILLGAFEEGIENQDNALLKKTLTLKNELSQKARGVSYSNKLPYTFA